MRTVIQYKNVMHTLFVLVICSVFVLKGKTKIDVYALIPDPAKRAAQETEELNRLLSNG